jgi:glycosyltransferase involved in cell wall biosynthesis
MKTLTIFTPTYNRAYCLHQVYNSMIHQNSKDFIWLIIDDGSTDSTKELVEGWQRENKIEVHYLYQENQGMHGAHNTAYQNIQTELNVCIDSDDYLVDNAVEQIINKWKTRDYSVEVAGIIGLDAYKDGSLVGSAIPPHVVYSGLSELYFKYKVQGDKKLVLRTDLVKKYPKYPLFSNEKFVPLGVLYTMISRDYKFICSNEVYCIVEYLPDGSSKNIYKQYKINPRGFRYSRLIEMQYSHSIAYTFSRAIHLISSSLFARMNPFKDNSFALITFFALPFGLLLHGYILTKIKA